MGSNIVSHRLFFLFFQYSLFLTLVRCPFAAHAAHDVSYNGTKSCNDVKIVESLTKIFIILIISKNYPPHTHQCYLRLVLYSIVWTVLDIRSELHTCEFGRQPQPLIRGLQRE